MRRLLFTTVALLSGAHACLAQVSTMGSTAMGLPSTLGTIQSSPLGGPSPFSALAQAAPDTTLAPVPLASDPTIPGTVVTCSTPTGQITPGTPAVPITSLPSTTGTTGATSSISAPTMSAGPVTSSTSTTGGAGTPLTLSAQPASSFMTDFPGTTIPAPQPPALPALPSPSITAMPVPTSSTVPGTAATSMPGTTATMTALTTTMSPNAMTPAAALGTIPTPVVITTIGNISPTSPLGSSSTTVCSSMPGGPPTNGAALPLSTPEIPANPSPGTIQQDVAQLGGTSIDPTIMPTPNTSACAESATMNLAMPGTMAPANATGAAATPGVSPPPGC
jgi:hypothetical protein